MSLGENSGLVLILKFRVKSSVISVRLLLTHHVLRVKKFKALCYSRAFICTNPIFPENRNIRGGNPASKQMFLNTENSFLLLLHVKKKCWVFFCFFAFWEFIYYHIQVSVTVPTYFLKALFEDVCTFSKKPAGMPQIVSVLFMTAK